MTSSAHQHLRPHAVRAIAVLLGAAAILAFVGQYTDLDLWLADIYYDPSANAFPWRNAWFATTFMHGHVKNALFWLSLLAMIAALADLLSPYRFISARRSVQLRILALSAFLEPMLVKTLKQTTYQQCPWSLEIYGGSEPMLRILDTVTADMHKAACFPAGHASAGMWLLAIAAFWLPGQPKRACLAYLAGLSVGLLLGWVQQMRGAHFLTHTLWTAWIASALFLLLVAAFSRQLRDPVATHLPAPRTQWSAK